MALYSLNGAYPKKLPERIRLSDGSTRTDSSTYTEEEIIDAGYVAVTDKPLPGEFQYVNWTGTEWSVTAWTTGEKSAHYRRQRDNLLEKTDKYALSDLTMSTEMATYRQALRDVPQQIGFPDTFTWPALPPELQEI